jgi:hypothetical protein
MMARRMPLSFRMRTVTTAVVALAILAVFTIAVPLAAFAPDARLFGLPLGAALSVPVGLPALALTMFWFSYRQNRDDERFRDDD